MSRRLYLVRHGQTTANVEHRLDTVLPGARLTPHGEEQADRLGRRVAAGAVPVARLVTSHAVRAAQTGAGMDRHLAAGARAVAGIHETQVGEFEGRNDPAALRAFAEVYRGWLGGDLGLSAPGGESGRDVLDRYLPVVDELRRAHLGDGDGDVYVVSHSAAIRLVAAHLAGIDAAFAMRNPLDNTESVVLTSDPDGWRCERWGAVELTEG